MNTTKVFAIVITIFALMTSSMAFATEDLKKVVEPFYSQILSRSSGADVKKVAEAILSPNWQSIGDYSGKHKSRDKFVKQFQYFSQLLPDMTFEIQEMIISGNQVVVRSRAVGTPADKFLGVERSGKSFDILAIDIHTIENGKIVKTYHVENWLAATAQLKNQ